MNSGLTLAAIDAARKALEDQHYRPCQHVVHPPKAGHRWEIVDDPSGETVHVLRCVSLCGWAAYAREVPV
jgi:hypothetical protein